MKLWPHLAEVRCRVRYKRSGDALLTRGWVQNSVTVTLTWVGWGFGQSNAGYSTWANGWVWAEKNGVLL